MHRDEVARADEPEHQYREHHARLRAKTREKPRGATAKLDGLALGDIVELLIFGKGRAKTHAGGFAFVDHFLGLVLGQDAARAVETVSKQRHEESL